MNDGEYNISIVVRFVFHGTIPFWLLVSWTLEIGSATLEASLIHVALRHCILRLGVCVTKVNVSTLTLSPIRYLGISGAYNILLAYRISRPPATRWSYFVGLVSVREHLVRGLCIPAFLPPIYKM